MSSHIVILSQPGCYRCKGVGRHLDTNGIDYQFVDVTQDESWRAWLQERAIGSVPVTVNIRTGEYVRDFDPDGVVALARA